MGIFDRKFRLDMILNGKQREGLRALRDVTKAYFLFDGGIRSGKTELIFSWLVARAVVYPGSKQIVIRKETAQHKRGFWGHGGTIHRFLYRTFEKAGLVSLYTLRESDMKLIFWNGSIISLEGVDTPQNIGRIYGDEYITIWFNEAWQMDFAVVQAVWSRAAQLCYAHPMVGGKVPWFPRQANKQIIFDTNPQGKRHWLYKLGILGLDPVSGEVLRNKARWKRVGGWKPWDNEANVNTEDMDDQMGVARQRNIDGEWCDMEGSVYDEFDEEVHVCKDCNGGGMCPRVFKDNGAIKASYLCRGVDFGMRDPTTMLWGAMMGGQLLIYRCYYKANKRSDVHAEAMLALQSRYEIFKWTVADHSPDHIAQFRKCGIKCRNAHKDNPIMAGISRVKRRLHAEHGIPGLKVCQFCTPVIDEMSSLMMDPKKDAPLGGNDHTCDTIRYMIAEIDGKRRAQAFIL